MDTVKNWKQETILKGLYLYRTLFSLSFLQRHWTLQSLSGTQGTTFLDLSGMGQFSPALEKNSDTVILGNNLKKGAKESAVFLSPDYWRQPEDPLSENAPLRATATGRQNLETAEIPWPRCHQRQCQQMEPRITAGPGFLLIINTVLRVVTALSPPVWQTPLLSPQGVLWSNTLIKTPSQILLLFSWKSIQEGSCTKAARQMTASKKKTNIKALPVVLLSPTKLNYSFFHVGNANVIAALLNKQCHHYNNHHNFYYFFQIKIISLLSGVGNFSSKNLGLWELVFNFILKGY